MNIHDSMLFRWIGYDLEKPNFKDEPAPRRPKLTLKPSLTDEQVAAHEDDNIRKNLRGKSGITAQLISAQALRKL